MAFGTAAGTTASKSSAARRAMRLSLPMITGALFSLPALAQTAAATDAPDTTQRVTVTGTMIPRASAETAEAITVITADSLKQMGITTVEQALGQISSNQSTVVTASTVSSWGTGGGSFASLRGLGGARTLVLLDGQRLAANAQVGSSVDLNAIPFAAIDRIEVLREGASSVYGADAIAGVINFITKKDYTGGQLNLTGSKTQHSGGGDYGGDITYGLGNLATDGYNLLGTLSYSKQKELRATQRTFASGKGVGYDNSVYYPFPASYEDSNGNYFSVDYPACTGNTTYLTKDGGYCGYKYTSATDLIPRSSITSGMLQLTKTLDADNTLKLQYLATQSKVTTWGGAYSYSATMNPVTDAQYFPTAANSSAATAAGTDAGATPDLSNDITVGWTDPNNNRYQGDKNLEQRFLANLTGAHGDWNYQANLTYSQNVSAVYLQGGYPDVSMLLETDANGDQVLNHLINPFGAQTAEGQALIDSSYKSGKIASATLRLVDANASASHEVGDWFGAGAATLALGFDARHEQIHSATTDLANTMSSETGYYPASLSGKRNSEAIYAEVNVPVLKQLEFTLSDREDHYSDFGSTNNAKLSFRYQPSKLVTFRGAASTGFRAPSLVNLYSPQVLGASTGFSGAVCSALDVTCGAQGMVLTGGNPNLKPEKSDNYDFGIVLSPVSNLGVTLDFYRITISNQITTLSSSTIYKNYSTFTDLYKLNSAGTLSVAGDGSCDAGPTAATCGYITRTVQNSGGVTTNGIDLSVNYTLNTSEGRFRMGLEGTWTSQYKLQAYKGAAWTNIRGDMSSGYEPVLAWQDTLSLDWTKAEWGAGISNHYESGYIDQNSDADGNARKVGAYSTWNVYGTWQATKQVKLLVGVRNLFDTNPSFSNQQTDWQGGYNPDFSDPTGRAVYGKVTVDF